MRRTGVIVTCVMGLVSVAGADWKSEANTRIEQIRKRDAKITIADPNGNPIPGVTLTIQQIKHRFGFGSAIRYQADQEYYTRFPGYFEWAVLENELKWGHDEPNQGDYHYDEADFLTDFCRTHGVKIRAHNIFWAGSVPGWVGALSDTSLQSAMNSRINSVVNRYEGKVLHWDVYNEMLNGSLFEDRLGASIKYWMFQRAREEDPTVKLFVNEVGVETSDTNVTRLVNMVQDLLAHGCDVGGIGLQAHLTTIDPYVLKTRLDTIAQFGIPIWITEFTTDAADNASRADVLEQVYRTAFSHPAVEGALMWGFWQGMQGMPGWYIVNQDWTLNPVGQRYFDLINEWTTNTSGVSGSAGDVSFRGFHGTYKVTLTKDGTSLGTQILELSPGAGQAEYTVSPIFADDFEDGQVDTTIWSAGDAGTVTESAGRLTLASVSGAQAELLSQAQICPTGDGTVILTSSGANFGEYVKGNVWGLTGRSFGGNRITLHTEDGGYLYVHMQKGGATEQTLSTGVSEAGLGGDIPFAISWSLGRVAITMSGVTIFDTAVNAVASDGAAWRIPDVPMGVYAQSGWNDNVLSFTEMSMQARGTVQVLSPVITDDFEDGVLNPSLWSTAGNAGTVTESGGVLTVQSLDSDRLGSASSTFALYPNGGTVMMAASVKFGWYMQGNKWGLQSDDECSAVYLYTRDDTGDLAVNMRSGGGSEQTLWVCSGGDLGGRSPFMLSWSAGRVIVTKDGAVLFDSTVNTTDRNGAAWSIPTVPMRMCIRSGWNANAVSLGDVSFVTTGAAQVLAGAFADDFNDGVVNPTIWDTSGNAGTITEAGGNLSLASIDSNHRAFIQSIASVDISGGKTALLTSQGVNFGWYVKGNEWGLHADDANFIHLYTEDSNNNLTLYMRSGGGNVQSRALCDQGGLGGYEPFTILWSAGHVVVTRYGAALFDSAINTTDSNGAPWVIPTTPMRVRAYSGWNSNAISFSDMTLQLTGLPDMTPNGLIQGTVTLQGYIGTMAGMAATIDLRNPGETAVVETHPVTLDAAGHYSFSTTRMGTFDVAAKVPNGLRQVRTNVSVTPAGVTADFGLSNGDANGDNQVTFEDFAILQNNYGQSVTPGMNGDFDGSGWVGFEDFAILQNSYGDMGVAGSQAPAAADAVLDGSADGCGLLGMVLMSVAGMALGLLGWRNWV